MELIVKKGATFEYPTPAIEAECMECLRIVDSESRTIVGGLIRIGEALNRARSVLPHGSFGKWFATYFIGSHEWGRRCRILAKHYPQYPQISEMAVEVALNFVEQDDRIKEEVLERKAYAWPEFESVIQDIACQRWQEEREQIEDMDIPYHEKVGKIQSHIEVGLEEKCTEDAALTVYEQYREPIAKLASREPAEIDVEMGIKPKETKQNGRPKAELVQVDNGLSLCQDLGDGKYKKLAHITAYVQVWGNGEPEIIVLFPNGGSPVASSWGEVAQRVVVKELKATTLERFKGVAL